jgi:hypothetical protein
VDWWGSIHKKWSKQAPQPTWMGTRESSLIGTLHFNKDMASTFGHCTVHDNCLSGIQYNDFLERKLPILLDDAPRGFCITALPHYSGQVYKWLNNYFMDTWIGCGSSAVWPPHFPDLNEFHSFSWGCI